MKAWYWLSTDHWLGVLLHLYVEYLITFGTKKKIFWRIIKLFCSYSECQWGPKQHWLDPIDFYWTVWKIFFQNTFCRRESMQDWNKLKELVECSVYFLLFQGKCTSQISYLKSWSTSQVCFDFLKNYIQFVKFWTYCASGKNLLRTATV